MPVTNDYDVARAINRKVQLKTGDIVRNKPATSAKIAERLQITVFQITARLKGMEGRLLVERKDGRWLLTADGLRLAVGERPVEARRVSRGPGGPGGAVPLPDDSGKPVTISTAGWKLDYKWWGTDSDQHHKCYRTATYTDPDGEEWVECDTWELCDLLVHVASLDRKIRLRPYEGSKAQGRINDWIASVGGRERKWLKE